MTEFKIPRRRMDDQGNWIIEQPPADPAAERQHQIDSWKNILQATHRDGSPAYIPSVRALAKKRLKELEGGDA